MEQISKRNIDDDKYRNVRLLGEGSFGKAFLIQRKIDGVLCVLKAINIK
jgi:serine/threonine protein kinase